MRCLTILTDFGTRDGFVAAMKGVIASIAPEVRIVDAAHGVEPGDVEAGTWVLSQYWSLFPEGTVHLVVIDPGVGSERRAIALEADGRVFVGPDNGLITRIITPDRPWRCFQLVKAEIEAGPLSRTFHGRDLFAPAAARIAAGRPLDQLGRPLASPVRLPLPSPERGEGEIRGEVAHVDRFGNLITNIPEGWVGPGWEWSAAGRRLGPIRDSYSEVGVTELLVTIGSAGTLEVAAREGSAAEILGIGRGADVLGKRVS